MAVSEKKAGELSAFLEKEGVPFQVDFPLKKATTFAIGGNAPLFIEPVSDAQIKASMAMIRQLETPFYILGRGSNVLFPDGEFPGVVLHIGSSFGQMTIGESGVFSAQSGAMLTDFARFVGDAGFTGLEFAYGIPGSVGGGVYMNAGAYGGEIKDVLTKVTYLNASGELAFLARDPKNPSPHDDFSYRHSPFTNSSEIIIEISIKVQKDDDKKIEETMESYMQARREKQPLEWPSAGSVFKRPKNGYASALIDTCGLKNLAVGGAEVSGKHAGFIINKGDASADDVLKLIHSIQSEVLRQTGTALECELKVATPMNP